jgi:ankyrin repeat protein
MSLFSSLPEDIQREVCHLLDKDELKKLSTKILKSHDVFWKEKLHRTYYWENKDFDYKILYERKFYKKLIKTHHKNGQLENLMYQLIDDDDFLKNHVNMKFNDHPNLLYAFCCIDNKEKEIRKLVLAGADVNCIKKSHSISVLIRAVIRQSTETVKLLLDAGADVSFGLHDIYTPLHYAANNLDVEKVKVLLNYGAKVDADTFNMVAPLRPMDEFSHQKKFEILHLLTSKM